MDTTINPNANYFNPGQGGNPVAPKAITPESLQSATPIQLPQQSTTVNSASYNASVPAPTIPTVESIVTPPAPTATEVADKSWRQKIADLIGGNKTKTQLQNEAGAATGLPALTSTLNDLNTQLEGLNNQDLALQNETVAGGAIENKLQLGILDRGITTKAGLAPMTTDELRKNQIKRAAISSSALTLKSAIYGAQGKYNIAKDAADKAAEAQYEIQQREIDGAKAQLDAIAPTLNKEEKAQATIQQAKLQERQSMIDNAKDDKKSIIAMATAALKNFPSDPQAQYAAQQAIAESNKEQPNLQVALSLIGKYQQDPNAVAKTVAEIAYTRAQTAKLNADVRKINSEMGGNIPTITNPQAGKYAGAVSVILGSDKFTAQTKKDFVNSINNGEDPFVVIKNKAKDVLGETQGGKVTSLEIAKKQINDLSSLLNQYYANGGKTSYLSGNYEKVVNKLGEVNDPNLVSIAVQISSALQQYRNAVSGTAYSVQEGKDIASIFPGIDNTKGLNDAILAGRKAAFDSSIDGAYKTVLGSTYDSLKTSQSVAPTSNGVSVTAPDGQVYTFPDQAKADAFKKAANIK